MNVETPECTLESRYDVRLVIILAKIAIAAIVLRGLIDAIVSFLISAHFYLFVWCFLCGVVLRIHIFSD